MISESIVEILEKTRNKKEVEMRCRREEGNCDLMLVDNFSLVKTVEGSKIFSAVGKLISV